MERKVRNRFITILLTALIIASVVVGGYYFPKYQSRLFGLGIFLMIDLFSWMAILRFARSFRGWIARIIEVWYWLPLGLFSLFLIFSFLWPLENWAAIYRIYFPGILVLAFLSKFIILLFFFLGKLLAFPVRIFNRLIYKFIQEDKGQFRKFFLSLGFILSTLITGFLFSGFFFWVYDFKVKTVEIGVKDLPPGLEGMRIAQLSDIHAGSWMSPSTMDDAFRLVNEQHPDLIVFTGDLVNFTTKEVYPFENSFRKLMAPLGTYAILGNHDYGDYVRWETEEKRQENNLELEEFYKHIGWNLLKNEHATIHKNGDSLALLGIENWSSNKIWGQKGDIEKALKGTEYFPVKVLLSHDPTFWDKVVLEKYPDIQLTLSGHTHAMQMGWDLGKNRWSPAKYLFTRWAGLYSIYNLGKEQFLYVNPGLGHLGLPGRVGIRPEITLIILKKEN